MAELDPFEPHREDEHNDEHNDEHEVGGDTDFNPNDHEAERSEQMKRLAMAEVTRMGFKAPADVYYDAFKRGDERFFAVSEDKIAWYQIKFGFMRGESVISLIPLRGEPAAPDSLKQKFGMETSHEGEMTQGAPEYLKSVFDNPKLDGVSYGVTADGRVWVSLSRTNAVKYFIEEDGTAKDIGGRKVKLPSGLKSQLGRTNVEVWSEREEMAEQKRKTAEYLSQLQEKDQENIELRELRKEDKVKIADAQEESKEKDRLIASHQEKLQKYEDHFEQLGVDIAEMREKEQYHKETINGLTERLENSLSPTEKARLTAELQMMSRENQANVENVNEKQRQLDQAARDVAQQKERITELETQKEELARTIAFQEGEIERLTTQIERNEREIGDRDMQEVEQERQELENEVERLEEQNREVFERLSLKEKVKAIFRKYGLTVFGVLAAVGTIIGVIVSNLKAGLQKVATGVGNGLKEIGKKLGQILPGMIGAIVSFLFKAAGEAVGFLGKHAWLLILLVVTFAVDQFKANNGKGK